MIDFARNWKIQLLEFNLKFARFVMRKIPRMALNLEFVIER